MERRSRIVHNVRSALARTPRGDLSWHGILVFFDGGDLVLEGEVDEIAEKKTALRAAAAVSGVSAIIDRLHLHRAKPCTDADLVRQVRRSLVEDPALAGCLVQSTLLEDHSRDEILCPEGWQGNIDFQATDGVLTLDGEVPSLAQKRLAGVLAWRLPGCRDVVNGIEVGPPEDDDDTKIGEAVSLVIARTDPATAAAVKVNVRGGVVFLDGRIDPAQARALERDVWAIFGVDQVVSGLGASPPLRPPARAPSSGTARAR